MTLHTRNKKQSPARILAALLVVGAFSMTAGAERPRGDSLSDTLHVGPGTSNHPVGVVPSDAVHIPDDWPLAEDGSITCLTCHEQLPSSPGTDPHLRDSDKTEMGAANFCMNCHGGGDGRTAADTHWMAVGVAHIKPGRDTPLSIGGPIDGQSRRCLQCHDGITASESTNPTASSSHQFGDLGRNHPVGIPYDNPTLGRKRTQLRPEHSLPPEVRLPDGKVSCVSCHDLYSSEPGRLSVPIEGSELCFTCHGMR